MVKRRRFLDVIPDAQAATSAQMTQVDRWSAATITGQEDSTRVSVHLEGSSQPDVVVPSDSGVSAVGARVRAFRDSTGRVTHVSIPDVIPQGAETFTVGVTGERLMQLDAVQVDQGAQIDRVEANAATKAEVIDIGETLSDARKAVTALQESQATQDTAITKAQTAASQAATAAAATAAAAIISVVTEYAVGSSETVAPTSGWSTSTPARTPGTFIWSRTTTTKGGETPTSTTAAPVLVTGNTGAKGDKGDTGADGVPGKDGVGLTGTAVSYVLSTSGTTTPTSGWSSTVPTLVKGRYLWTRTVWTYSDATTETGYSVAYVGTDGSSGTDGLPGKDGVGITGTSIAYAVSASGTTAPSSGWQATPPAASAGQFMWTRTTWTYSDASTEVGYSVGKIGETGATGAAGKGIASSTVTYQGSASGTTAPTGTWSSTVPTVAQGQYLWTRTVIVFTDGASTTSYSIGRMGEQGVKGDTGSTGAGVSSVTTFYALVGQGVAAPVKPTVNPPSAPWSLTEPAYTSNTELYRVDLTVLTSGTWSYGAVSKVSSYTAANAAQAKADALRASARNLLAGTDVEFTNTYPSSGYSDKWSAHTIDPATDSEYVLTFEASSTVDGDTIFCYFYNPNTTTSVESSTGFTSTTTSGDGWAKVELTTTPQRYWVKWKQSATTTTKRVIVGRCPTGNGTGTVTIRQPMLVAGNIPADWTPAPEDISDDIDTAQSRAQQALTVANLAQASAQGLVTASTTAPDVTQVGKVWLVLNGSGNVVGMKISNGSAWASYAMIVEDLMVVGEDGTIQLRDNTVTAGTIVATAIDGMTITGATLQTDADDSTGLKITPLGLIAFNTDGDPSVWIGRDGTMSLGAGSLNGTALASGTVDPTALDMGSTVPALAQAGIADALDLSNNTSVSAAVSTAIAPVQSQAAATAQGLAQQQAYFRFQQDSSGNPVLALGASTSPNQLRLTNEEVSLLQGGYVVSRWNAGRMEVSQMKVNSIIIGNHQMETLNSVETVVKSLG